MLNMSGKRMPLTRRVIAAIFPRMLIRMIIAAVQIIFALVFNLLS